MKKRLQKYILIGLCITAFNQGYAYTLQGLLTRDYSATNTSLGGIAHAIPNGTAMLYANPAQIHYSHYADLGLYYEEGAFNTNYGSAVAAFHIYEIPFAVSAANFFPVSVGVVNDFGDERSSQVSEYSIGLTSGHEFKFGSQKLMLGATGRFHHSEILDSTSDSAVFDIGVMMPFVVEPFFFSKRRFENLFVSLAGRNIGPERQFSDSSATIAAPTVLSFSTAWLFWYDDIHKAYFLNGFNMTLYENDVFEYSTYSVGVEYALYEMIYTRAAATLESSRTTFQLGGGLKYGYHNLYEGKVNYSFNPNSDLNDTHQVDILFSYKYDSTKQKIRNQNEMHYNLGKQLNTDILEVMRDGIRLYKLEYGQNPKSLAGVQPFLKKKYGMERMPQPPSGTFFYDSQTGELKILDVNEFKFKDKFHLKNGSVLICNVLYETKDGYLVEHEYGTLEIPKRSIQSRSSQRFSAIDRVIISTLQDYINDFYNKKNRYPKNLKELEKYLKTIGVKNMPRPINGQLKYTASSGNITLEQYYDPKVANSQPEEAEENTKSKAKPKSQKGRPKVADIPAIDTANDGDVFDLN